MAWKHLLKIKNYNLSNNNNYNLLYCKKVLKIKTNNKFAS